MVDITIQYPGAMHDNDHPLVLGIVGGAADRAIKGLVPSTRRKEDRARSIYEMAAYSQEEGPKRNAPGCRAQ
jgi:hypothetical protein